MGVASSCPEGRRTLSSTAISFTRSRVRASIARSSLGSRVGFFSRGWRRMDQSAIPPGAKQKDRDRQQIPGQHSTGPRIRCRPEEECKQRDQHLSPVECRAEHSTTHHDEQQKPCTAPMAGPNRLPATVGTWLRKRRAYHGSVWPSHAKAVDAAAVCQAIQQHAPHHDERQRQPRPRPRGPRGVTSLPAFSGGPTGTTPMMSSSLPSGGARRAMSRNSPSNHAPPDRRWWSTGSVNVFVAQPAKWSESAGPLSPRRSSVTPRAVPNPAPAIPAAPAKPAPGAGK